MKRKIARLALTEAALTLLWVILMILGEALNGPVTTLEDAIQRVQSINFLHVLTYANAAALTAVAVLLYFAFYQYLKSDYTLLSALGLVFVPLYGIFNLLVYLSQITIVPLLAARSAPALANWLQIWPQSPNCHPQPGRLYPAGYRFHPVWHRLRPQGPRCAHGCVAAHPQRRSLHPGPVRRVNGQSPARHGFTDWRRPLPGRCGNIGVPVSGKVGIFYQEHDLDSNNSIL
jgi:hypothetical protein